jgi:hypothetical protein
MRFNAHHSKSHYELSKPFKNARLVAYSLRGIHSTLSCLFIVNGAAHKGLKRPYKLKNLKDCSVASGEATQYVILYLSIGHDRCY